MLRAILIQVADATAADDASRLLLDQRDPLVRFFRDGGATVENYLALDDFAVWSTISRIAECEDEKASDLARRLRERRLYKALDINADCPALPGENPGTTEERRQRESMRLEEVLKDEIGKSVLIDVLQISIYGEIGEDQAKTHKMLAIRLRDNSIREITDLSPLIRTLGKKREVVRFYFSDDAARDRARDGRAK